MQLTILERLLTQTFLFPNLRHRNINALFSQCVVELRINQQLFRFSSLHTFCVQGEIGFVLTLENLNDDFMFILFQTLFHG